jgi:hypothetical protein
VNPLFLGFNPFFGVNPLLTGVANPLLLSAQLNPLTNLNLALRRPVVMVSPRTSLLVSPSMLLLGTPGINSLPLVGLGSLAAGGITTPATLPFVVALNSEVNLSPEEEKEFQRKVNLVKSQTGASPPTVWSGKDINVLMDDLKSHQNWSGREVALSEDTLRHINIVPIKGDRSGDLLWNVRLWPDLLKRPTFKEEREQIESLIPELIQQARTGKIHAAGLDALDINLGLMRDELASMIKGVPAPQYIRAKRFLADLESGTKVLRRTDAANYFPSNPKAKNVEELVQFMAKNDLRFAPALKGDEAAYLILYRALAIYDVSVNLLSTDTGNRMMAR